MKKLKSWIVPFAAVAIGALSVGDASSQTSREAQAEKGSQPSAAEKAPDGAALFKVWCASCHGITANGTGPLAPQMRRRVPDLTQIAEKNGGLFPVARVRRIIDGRDVGAHGNPDMPVWGSAFKASGEAITEAAVRARIDALVRYLETIQRRNAQ